MVRLFVAISLSEDIRKQIGCFAEECAGHGAQVKYVAPENWHLTVKFLGETDPDSVDDLCLLLSSVESPVFDLVVSGAGFFSRKSDPKVVWVGAEESGGLLSLYNEVERSVHSLGFPRDDRAFRPHITIGRAKKPLEESFLSFIDHNRDREFGRQTVKSFSLYKSDLTGNSPVYSVIRDFPLRDSL